MSKRFAVRKALSEIIADFLRPFRHVPWSVLEPHFAGDAQRGIDMEIVEKATWQLPPLRAGARFSNPERVEDTEVEVEIEDEGQRVQYKKMNQTGR